MGERLRQWMEEHGIGNTDLARDLGFSREFVWQVANGRREVTGEFRWRFAEKFGWDEAQSLFGITDLKEAPAPTPDPA